MSTRDPNNWDTHDARTDAMTRLVRHLDGLQGKGSDQESVGIEMSPAMQERLAEELDLEGRIQTAMKDALQDGLLQLFIFPATLITDTGEVATGDRHPILWMHGVDLVDPSDPRGDGA